MMHDVHLSYERRWTSILTEGLTFKHGTSNGLPTALYLALVESQLQDKYRLSNSVSQDKLSTLLTISA